MAFRNPEQIRQSAIDFIDARLSGIRTEAGEPIVDLIDAVAVEQGRSYTVMEYLRRINSIDGWRQLISDENFKVELADALSVSNDTLNVQLARSLGVPDDLESDIEAIYFYDLNRFAASYAIDRKDATFATTTERLFLSSNAPFTALRGAIVRVGGDTGVPFATTDDLIGVIPALDPVENLYFVDAGMRCQVSGVAGNQVVNSIKVISPPIQGVIRATNIIPAEGGLPRETNEDLLDRLEGSLEGRDIATVTGLKNFVLGQADVFDALVIGPGHPLMTRVPAGGIDIYIIGSRLATVKTQTQIISAGEEYILQYQPLRAFNAAKNLTSLATYQPGAGMALAIDTAEFADSAQANDKVIWDGITGPAPGDLVEVDFTYNALLRDIQLQLDDDPDHDVPASSILIKEGKKIDVAVSMRVVIVPGQDQSLVEQAVQTALQGYFSLLKLGEVAEYSTALSTAASAQIDGIPVVDRIDDFVMGFVGDTLTTANIEPGENEYARLFSIAFASG